jgi:drug efflux transport system permease protein
MITRLAAQIVKELLSYLRDPKSRLTLVGPPLMQLLVFSYAATLEVDNIQLAVLDQDNGYWSQEMIREVEGAGFVREIRFVHSPDELTAMIDRREVLAGLRFPQDFSRDVARGKPAAAQAVIDGRRAYAGQVTLAYLNQIAANVGAEIHPGNAAPPTAVRHWFNPNLIYKWFIVPSLSGILAMLIALLVTALSIARERELGTFDQLLVSPARPIEIIIGKTVPALIIGTILASVMIAAGIFLFGIPFAGSLGWLLAAVMLFMLSMVGIGLVISSICQTQQQAILGIFAITVPIVLMSGFVTPVENMSGFLQLVARVNPMTYYLIIVRGSFLKALPVSEILANAWPMALIGLVTLSSAIVIVKRNLQ